MSGKRIESLATIAYQGDKIPLIQSLSELPKQEEWREFNGRTVAINQQIFYGNLDVIFKMVKEGYVRVAIESDGKYVVEIHPERSHPSNRFDPIGR